VLAIVVQGLTMAPFLRRLGITGVKDIYQEKYEMARGRLGSINAVLSTLESMRRERDIPAEVLVEMERDYQRKATDAQQELTALQQQTTRFLEEEHQEVVRRVLFVEKESLLKAYQKGTIGKEAFEHLMAELDERLSSALAAQRHVQPPELPPAAPEVVKT
jgi:CPA1 family monovalent cation:H+ antiporter